MRRDRSLRARVMKAMADLMDVEASVGLELHAEREARGREVKHLEGRVASLMTDMAREAKAHDEQAERDTARLKLHSGAVKQLSRRVLWREGKGQAEVPLPAEGEVLLVEVQERGAPPSYTHFLPDETSASWVSNTTLVAGWLWHSGHAKEAVASATAVDVAHIERIRWMVLDHEGVTDEGVEHVNPRLPAFEERL